MKGSMIRLPETVFLDALQQLLVFGFIPRSLVQGRCKNIDPSFPAVLVVSIWNVRGYTMPVDITASSHWRKDRSAPVKSAGHYHGDLLLSLTAFLRRASSSFVQSRRALTFNIVGSEQKGFGPGKRVSTKYRCVHHWEV